MTPAIQLFSAERDRQIIKEGFTRAADQHYTAGELLRAAQCYTEVVRVVESGLPMDAAHALVMTSGQWPWDVRWFKTPDTKTCLVKAGALLAAHLDAKLPEDARYTGPSLEESASDIESKLGASSISVRCFRADGGSTGTSPISIARALEFVAAMATPDGSWEIATNKPLPPTSVRVTFSSIDDLVATLPEGVREKYRELVRRDRRKLADAALELCHLIEKAGASEALTACGVAASALHTELNLLAHE